MQWVLFAEAFFEDVERIGLRYGGFRGARVAGV
jgi:hypothetical protein